MRSTSDNNVGIAPAVSSQPTTTVSSTDELGFVDDLYSSAGAHRWQDLLEDLRRRVMRREGLRMPLSHGAVMGAWFPLLDVMLLLEG